MRGLRGLSETMIGREEEEDQTKKEQEGIPGGGHSRAKGEVVVFSNLWLEQNKGSVEYHVRGISAARSMGPDPATTSWAILTGTHGDDATVS